MHYETIKALVVPIVGHIFTLLVNTITMVCNFGISIDTIIVVI